MVFSVVDGGAVAVVFRHLERSHDAPQHNADDNDVPLERTIYRMVVYSGGTLDFSRGRIWMPWWKIGVRLLRAGAAYS